ncbi:MAG: TetR/AcrR family transcriptional regulator [Anaerolineae bacterium]|nr:TetR/AcrR family transcriptional regulator [Anaerolineae bacterium]MCB0249264.1 TetR/AcrR family transcriptional regulator [Anaerolineae bacterium]MCB9133257.1 TetR/AcrR family transcriptional regulator [Anaerolineales bacterium]MCO5244746.1 TetR/AcrR family transcriptional regulator [Anaerolineae bacterium]
MPKETFFNLPDDKRSLICDVAIEEFTEYLYDQASVNRIVAKAGIAKGSFYQYFEDKKDLYMYVLQVIAEKKLEYISPVMRNPYQHDIFTLLREVYLSGIQFAANHPDYAEIGTKLLQSKNSPIFDQVVDENLPAANDMFEALLARAVERGEIKADTDVKLFAYMISSMTAVVSSYYVENVATTYGDELMETVDKFLDFLKHGLGTDSSQLSR